MATPEGDHPMAIHVRSQATNSSEQCCGLLLPRHPVTWRLEASYSESIEAEHRMVWKHQAAYETRRAMFRDIMSFGIFCKRDGDGAKT
jgi:hypothetical protein